MKTSSEEPRSPLRGSSKEKANVGAAAKKPQLAIHSHGKLRGIMAFSHKLINTHRKNPGYSSCITVCVARGCLLRGFYTLSLGHYWV